MTMDQVAQRRACVTKLHEVVTKATIDKRYLLARGTLEGQDLAHKREH